MKRFIASLVFIMLFMADLALAQVGINPPSNPCVQPGAILQTVSGSTSGTAAVQLVGTMPGARIYICSMNVTGTSGTTPTFSLVYGTGSNCGTGQNVLIPAWTLTAGSLYPFSMPTAVTPVSQALCSLQTGTTPVAGYAITYIQQ